MLDCCFSGPAPHREHALAEPAVNATERASRTGAYTMTASRADTTAWFETDPDLRQPQTPLHQALRRPGRARDPRPARRADAARAVHLPVRQPRLPRPAPPPGNAASMRRRGGGASGPPGPLSVIRGIHITERRLVRRDGLADSAGFGLPQPAGAPCLGHLDFRPPQWARPPACGTAAAPAAPDHHNSPLPCRSYRHLSVRPTARQTRPTGVVVRGPGGPGAQELRRDHAGSTVRKDREPHWLVPPSATVDTSCQWRVRTTPPAARPAPSGIKRSGSDY